MKSVLRCTLACFLAGSLYACGGGGEDGTAGQASEQGQSAPAETYGLVLNAGERWEMDDHTRSSFAAMDERMKDFDLNTANTPEVQAMGAALRKDLDGLIAGCTMTGAAHDELHKYLVPFIPAIDQMAANGSAADAQEVMALLDTYPRFFK